jgi:hypothetical protein
MDLAPSMPTHDHAYKNMFSTRRAVEQLLTGFVHEDWVERLDFSTLENINASYVTEDLKGRADDLIWRLRMHESPSDSTARLSTTSTPITTLASAQKPKRLAKAKSEWLYIYLMLEFQSSNDRHMAVRLMTYIGLLYQRLIQNGEIRKSGKLPSVFPLVLYNGTQPWTSATDLDDLIDPGPASLNAYRPQFRYFVLDECHFPQDQLPQNNVVAGILQVEQATLPLDLAKVLTTVDRVLELPQNQEVKRAIVAWLNGLVMPRILKRLRLGKGKDALSEAQFLAQLPIQPIPELQKMLNDQMDKWQQSIEKRVERRVLKQGLLLGEQRGMLLGEQRGMLLGEQRGILLGEQRGKLEAQSYTLRRLMSRRFGVLSLGVSAQIAAADITQIELWLDRVLDAPSVDAVLMNS